MTQTVLILGSSGKFGRHAATAFAKAGWIVRCFDRATDDLKSCVRSADVVVNGWNPPDYTTWARDLLPLHQSVLEAAQGTNATLIVPGNVYVFGAETPMPWGVNTPHRAQNPLGKLRTRMEDMYRNSPQQVILIRAGDFIDTEASGNWFDRIMVASLSKGVFTYPGNGDIPHAWAYLPDLGRATVELAERRADLPKFCDVPYSGFTMTGREMAQALETAIQSPVRYKTMNWAPVLVLKWVMPSLRGVCEMRYLWDTAHRLDPMTMQALLPDFAHTDPVDALARAAAHAAPKGKTNLQPARA